MRHLAFILPLTDQECLLISYIDLVCSILVRYGLWCNVWVLVARLWDNESIAMVVKFDRLICLLKGQSFFKAHLTVGVTTEFTTALVKFGRCVGVFSMLTA